MSNKVLDLESLRKSREPELQHARKEAKAEAIRQAFRSARTEAESNTKAATKLKKLFKSPKT